MKAIFVDKGKPKKVDISFNLDEIQKLIDGYVEIVSLRFYERDKNLKDIVLLIDDYGRLKPKPLNIVIGTETPIYGPAVFTKTDAIGEFVELSDKDIKNIYKYLGYDEITTLNERI